MLPVNRDSSISFFPINMPSISLPCFTSQARTYSTMLSKSSESKYPCIVPDLRRKVFSLSPLRMMLAVDSL